MLDAEDGTLRISIECGEHGESAVTPVWTVETVGNILGVLSGLGTTNIDSGAVSVSSASAAAQAVEQFKAAGIDLDALGAKTWSYNKTSNHLAWTMVDISAMSVGDKDIPVIRYNASSGKYTVWYATVKESSTATSTESYNVLDILHMTPYTPSTTNQTAENQTLEKAQEYYEALLEEYMKAQGR